MKSIIHTSSAPAAIGPYSQAVRHEGLVYTSGQIAIDPATGDLNISDIEAETHQVMNNLSEVLKAGGSSLAQVISTSVFVKDMGDYDRINRVYASYFDEAQAPARALVQVSMLPKDVNIEISAIAISSDPIS